MMYIACTMQCRMFTTSRLYNALLHMKRLIQQSVGSNESGHTDIVGDTLNGSALLSCRHRGSLQLHACCTTLQATVCASATTRANSVDSTLQSTPALTASKEPEPDLSRWCSHRRGSYKSSSLRCWCLHAASLAPMALTYRMRWALAMATWQDFRDILANKHTGCHGHVLTKASLIACNVLPCPPMHEVPDGVEPC